MTTAAEMLDAVGVGSHNLWNGSFDAPYVVGEAARRWYVFGRKGITYWYLHPNGRWYMNMVGERGELGYLATEEEANELLERYKAAVAKAFDGWSLHKIDIPREEPPDELKEMAANVRKIIAEAAKKEEEEVLGSIWE